MVSVVKHSFFSFLFLYGISVHRHDFGFVQNNNESSQNKFHMKETLHMYTTTTVV